MFLRAKDMCDSLKKNDDLFEIFFLHGLSFRSFSLAEQLFKEFLFRRMRSHLTCARRRKNFIYNLLSFKDIYVRARSFRFPPRRRGFVL